MLSIQFILVGVNDAQLNENITRFHQKSKNYHLWTVIIGIRDSEIKGTWEITVEAQNEFIAVNLFD